MAGIEIVGLGVAAHVGAGATPPSAGHVLLLAGVVAAVCLALHHRLVRWPVATMLVAVVQLVVHTAGSVAAAPAAHAGHLDAETTPAPGAPMLLAHAVGAAMTALVLFWQDRVVLAAMRALTPLSSSGPGVADVDRSVPSHRPQWRRAIGVFDLAPRRGPPTGLAPARS